MNTKIDSVTITIPDDGHVHFRDDGRMEVAVPYTARSFRRALVMPNDPVIETGPDAVAYYDRIMRVAGLDGRTDFVPLMTIKLTHRTTPSTIRAAQSHGVVAAKLYPQGVTTGSHDGITDPLAPELREVYRSMAEVGMVLCIHGEMPGVFVLDRERAYLDSVQQIAEEFPTLKVVLEHITTKRAVELVFDGPPNLSCSITVHHLLDTLDAVLGEGIKTHNFCYPVPKTEDDLYWLRQMAFGNLGRKFNRFHFGSDSAPHFQHRKEAACGCAGVFSALVALPLLAEVFEDSGLSDWIERLEWFTSRNFASFYGLPRNEGVVTMVRGPWTVPELIGGVVPYRAGCRIQWHVC